MISVRLQGPEAPPVGLKNSTAVIIDGYCKAQLTLVRLLLIADTPKKALKACLSSVIEGGCQHVRRLLIRNYSVVDRLRGVCDHIRNMTYGTPEEGRYSMISGSV